MIRLPKDSVKINKTEIKKLARVIKLKIGVIAMGYSTLRKNGKYTTNTNTCFSRGFV